MTEGACTRVTATFGVFEVNLRSRELFRCGVRVRLGDRPFQVLQALLERPGELVTREELRQKLWGEDTFVDFEHGLNTAVKRLRQVLGDEADAPRFIETVPRRGYRFIASVEWLSSEDGARARRFAAGGQTGKGSASGQVQNQPVWSLARRVPRLLALLVAAFLVGSFFVERSTRVQRTESGRTPQANPARVESLIVLPFRNLSANEAEAFRAEELTSVISERLERGGGVRLVRSRAADDRAIQVDESVSEGDADVVLAGEVRYAGGKARVTARLIDARDGRVFWSGNYARPQADWSEDRAAITQLVAEDVEKAIGAHAVALPPGTRPR